MSQHQNQDQLDPDLSTLDRQLSNILVTPRLLPSAGPPSLRTQSLPPHPLTPDLSRLDRSLSRIFQFQQQSAASEVQTSNTAEGTSRDETSGIVSGDTEASASTSHSTPREEEPPIQAKTTREVVQDLETILSSAFSSDVWNGRGEPNAIREAFSCVVVPLFKVIGRHVNFVLEGLEAKYAETNDDQWINLHELASNLVWNKGFHEPVSDDEANTPCSSPEEEREYHLRDALNVLERLKGQIQQLAQGSSHNLPTDPKVTMGSHEGPPSPENDYSPIEVEPSVLSPKKAVTGLCEPQSVRTVSAPDPLSHGSSFAIISSETLDASNCPSSYAGMTPHTQSSSNGASSFDEITPPSTESFERVSQAHSQESIPPTLIMEEEVAINLVNSGSSSDHLDSGPSPSTWDMTSGPTSQANAPVALSSSISPHGDICPQKGKGSSQELALGPDFSESPLHGPDLSEEAQITTHADPLNHPRFQVTLLDPALLEHPDPLPAPPPLPVATMPSAFPAVQQRILNHTYRVAKARHTAEIHRRMAESSLVPNPDSFRNAPSHVFQPPRSRPSATPSALTSHVERAQPVPPTLPPNAIPIQRPAANAIRQLNARQLDTDQRTQEWNANREEFVRKEQEARLERIRLEHANAQFGLKQPVVVMPPPALMEYNVEGRIGDKNDVAVLNVLPENRPEVAPPANFHRRRRPSQATPPTNPSSTIQEIENCYRDPSRL